MEVISPTERAARVMVKVGPVRARFTGHVRMEDIRPGEGCTLHFEGSGGPAGMAKGHSAVNLTDEESVRYLQADLQLMTRDADTLAAFTRHAPAIRNRLLLLFGQQSATQLAQRSGKERLQEAALAEVRRLLKSEGAADKVEAVIFTSLVTQ